MNLPAARRERKLSQLHLRSLQKSKDSFPYAQIETLTQISAPILSVFSLYRNFKSNLTSFASQKDPREMNRNWLHFAKNCYCSMFFFFRYKSREMRESEQREIIYEIKSNKEAEAKNATINLDRKQSKVLKNNQLGDNVVHNIQKINKEEKYLKNLYSWQYFLVVPWNF